MNEKLSRCPVLHGVTTSAGDEPVRPASATRPLRFPSGVDLSDPGAFVNGVPYDAFRKLRRENPVSWQDEPNGTGFWSIVKYDDVQRCSRNHRVFSSGRKGCFMFDPPADDLERMQMMMVNMDPPRHTKYRGIVNKGFTPHRMRLLENHVREICKKIIDNVAKRGECDFVKDVAAELPLQVIAELMGIPLEEREMVFDWSNRLIGFDDPEFQTSMEDGKIAAAEMYVYANQLAEARRANPKDDLTSILMNAEVEGEHLNELEYDLFFLLLAVAGNETTRNLISQGMLKLIENPGELARLYADRSLVDTAVEEMIRVVTPVMQFRRTLTEDIVVGDQQLRENDKVIFWYVSANRDEDVFRDPDRFDVGRTPNEHLGFGIGQHFCLGANLARLEIRIMFEELLGRIRDVELAGPIRRLRSNFIHGIKSMPVRFTPEA